MHNLHTEIDDAIRQAEARLREAMLTSDVAELDALIDDQLVFIGPDGGVYHKADDLALYRSGTQQITRNEALEFQVVPHGDTAIALVLTQLEGRINGQPFAGRYRYLRTWIRGTRGWQIIAGSVCAA